MTENDKKLSQSKEKLLCCYHDSECGFLSSCYVKFFIKKSSEAKAFLSTLRSQSTSIKKASSDVIPGCSDSELWKRIEARIHQEEYAAKFQGSRISHESYSWFRSFARNTALWGGASGAAVAATVILLLLPTNEQASQAVNQVAQQSTNGSTILDAGSLQPVRFAQNMKQRPVITEHGFNSPSAIEVDWMKGNGPVRVVEDPEERSALIWVTKRTPQQRSPYSAPFITEKRLPQIYSAGSVRR